MSLGMSLGGMQGVCAFGRKKQRETEAGDSVGPHYMQQSAQE